MQSSLNLWLKWWLTLLAINLQHYYCSISEWDDFNVGAPFESGFVNYKSLAKISGRAISGDIKKCSESCGKMVRLVCDKEDCENDPYCSALKCCGCYTRPASCPRCPPCDDSNTVQDLTSDDPVETTCPPCEYQECECPTPKPCPACPEPPECPKCPEVDLSKCPKDLSVIKMRAIKSDLAITVELPAQFRVLESQHAIFDFKPLNRFRSMSVRRSDIMNTTNDGSDVKCFPCPTCAPCPPPEPCAECPPTRACPSLDECPDQEDACEADESEPCQEMTCVKPYCKCTFCEYCAEKVACRCKFGATPKLAAAWRMINVKK